MSVPHWVSKCPLYPRGFGSGDVFERRKCVENQKIEINIDETELKEAEKEAGASHGDFMIKLGEPFTYEGKTFSELHFDWSKLTGKDSLAIERELQLRSIPVAVREISCDYQLLLAVKSSREKVSSDFIQALPIKKFNKIVNAARSFLMRAE